ncbi:hypothetical protein Q4489_17335 [Thalassotalea sp. 1_MG-2023]|uniref:hypothetical protein n=1 Tax=Thalassotalea sp. 1_MG-2023 TaxID=3062680 RepID=UPI0026E44B0C|nr:hypothetical protein [Thalassotalea sp. 1_MG-2023]MDO6428775.1 hypothetical protein [Thalassotalea sp. 1_MG-2023]
MTGATMIVLIVLISVGFGVLYDMYKKHLAFKERTQTNNHKTNEQNIALKNQVNALEERIQVLEKIVTDQGYQVSQEIEKL